MLQSFPALAASAVTQILSTPVPTRVVDLQFNDGSMLAVALAKYKLMFDEVDTSGNGTLGAAEVQHFFQK